MQFFDMDGVELDVQDPRFFIDEEEILEKIETLTEMFNTYA